MGRAPVAGVLYSRSRPSLPFFSPWLETGKKFPCAACPTGGALFFPVKVTNSRSHEYFPPATRTKRGPEEGGEGESEGEVIVRYIYLSICMLFYFFYFFLRSKGGGQH